MLFGTLLVKPKYFILSRWTNLMRKSFRQLDFKEHSIFLTLEFVYKAHRLVVNVFPRLINKTSGIVWRAKGPTRTHVPLSTTHFKRRENTSFFPVLNELPRSWITSTCKFSVGTISLDSQNIIQGPSAYTEVHYKRRWIWWPVNISAQNSEI